MSYNPRYYKLDVIPEHRLQLLELRLKRFIEDYGIRKWPIDSLKLLKQIKKSRLINLDYDFISGCSERFDAQARYYKQKDLYIILVNKDKIHYPWKFSRDRRLNFTLAHEFGHIFLDHLHIPDSCKTSEQISIENEEANEFAGRLLMPANLLFNSNFVSQEAVATHFSVSDQALWKRLNHLKRLDLLKSKPVNICEFCGNNSISPAAYFCPICGEFIRDKMKGVMPVYYNDGHALDENSRALKCPVCENEEMSPEGRFCRICGSILTNFCTYCEALAEGNSRYCEHCGTETSFFQANYLSDWQSAKARIKVPEKEYNEWSDFDLNEVDTVDVNSDEIPF